MAGGTVLRRIVTGGKDQGNLAKPSITRITFNRHIAPILHEQCVSCHHEGPGPSFSLVRYGEVKERADALLRAVQNESMPPWLPDRGAPRLVGERGLAPGQIALIREWIGEGTLEGEPEDLPKLVLPSTAWSGGSPDAIAELPQPRPMAPNPKGQAAAFALKNPIRGNRRIKGIEFQVSEPRSVRLLALQVQRGGSTETRLGGPIDFPPGQLPVWSQGQPPLVPTQGWELEEATELSLYVATLPNEAVPSIQVGFYFDSSQAPALNKNILLGPRRMEPGPERADGFPSYELPVPVTALGAFVTGLDSLRRLELRATLTNGESTSLLSIRNWNPRWQESYQYATPIPLPKGTVLSLFHLDNASEPAGAPPTQAPVINEVVLQVQVSAPADLEMLK